MAWVSIFLIPNQVEIFIVELDAFLQQSIILGLDYFSLFPIQLIYRLVSCPLVDFDLFNFNH